MTENPRWTSPVAPRMPGKAKTSAGQEVYVLTLVLRDDPAFRRHAVLRRSIRRYRSALGHTATGRGLSSFLVGIEVDDSAKSSHDNVRNPDAHEQE